MVYLSPMNTWIKRCLYRSHQVWRALYPSCSSEQIAWAQAILNPEEQAIWLEMVPADRCHTLQVALLCQQAANEHQLTASDRDLLLRAALLHDMGKRQATIRLWHRIAYVLIPALRTSPYDTIACHALIGAGEAEERGWPEELITLIREHHRPIDQQRLPHAHQEPVLLDKVREKRLLTLLQDADDQS